MLLLAGCGSTWRPKVEGPYLQGKLQYWLVRPPGKPKAVVILVHGLTQHTGEQLVQWQKHLAEQGDAVIFPRYEQPAADPSARITIAVSSFQALDRLGDPKVPLVIVGHSRGARLAVEAASDLHPKLIVALFPGLWNRTFELPTDLSQIPATTKIDLFSGDRDTVVGTAGVKELVERLHAAGRTAHVAVIHSGAGFSATHDSVYRTDAAAQRAIWARVDRLIASARR
ncbi:MAG TPA: dienelactone hydrolase family protein [Gaiellaceae bacterium]|nr:dienelactone hydrolase family protein [Gaiellaceae bacterium]